MKISKLFCKKKLLTKFFLGRHFNESQSNLLVQVLKNMVTPESILYSYNLFKAADNFIQLKKFFIIILFFIILLNNKKMTLLITVLNH